MTLQKEIDIKLKEIGNITLKEDISNLDRKKIGYLIKDIVDLENKKIIQSTKKEMLDDVLKLIKGYIIYRGGMGTRIDAYDIIDLLKGKKKKVEKFIKQKLKGDKK